MVSGVIAIPATAPKPALMANESKTMRLTRMPSRLATVSSRAQGFHRLPVDRELEKDHQGQYDKRRHADDPEGLRSHRGAQNSDRQVSRERWKPPEPGLPIRPRPNR